MENQDCRYIEFYISVMECRKLLVRRDDCGWIDGEREMRPESRAETRESGQLYGET
jgi:hypothetical protein